MNKKYVIAAVVFGMMVSHTAHAATDLLFKSVKQMGMGGAGIATAKNVDALILNPAGLASSSRFKLDLLDFYIGASPDMINKKDDIEKLFKGDLTISQVQAITPLSFTGHAGGGFGFGWRGFGVGVASRAVFDGALSNPTSPTVQYQAIADTQLAVGKSFNQELLAKDWVVGVSGKFVSRRQFASSISNAQLVSFLATSSDLPTSEQSRSGFGIDLGAKTDASIPFIGEASVGLSAQNIGLTLTGDGADETIPFKLGAGVAFKSNFPGLIPVVSTVLSNWEVAADYYVISDNTGFMKNLHIGAEKRILWNRILFRGGLNQGFFVGGGSFDLFLVKVHYNYFKEALGDSIDDDQVDFHTLGFEIGL